MTARVDFYERVPGHDYQTQVYLQGVDEGLEITTDTGDEQTTVVLSEYGIRELRLALTRYERQAAKATA